MGLLQANPNWGNQLGLAEIAVWDTFAQILGRPVFLAPISPHLQRGDEIYYAYREEGCFSSHDCIRVAKGCAIDSWRERDTGIDLIVVKDTPNAQPQTFASGGGNFVIGDDGRLYLTGVHWIGFGTRGEHGFRAIGQ